MPRCEYTLRKDHANGPVVQYAILGKIGGNVFPRPNCESSFLLNWHLGQPVYHRWECVEEGGQDTFGMLVHSCYVDNGFGDRVDIIDENGCGLDAASFG